MTNQNTQHSTQANSDEPVQTNIVNGVDLGTLGGTVSAIQGDPELGACHFRATNKWVDGAFNRSTVSGFYGAKQEDSTRTQAFILEGDEPGVLLGEDHGPNAVEAVLHALNSCLRQLIYAHKIITIFVKKELWKRIITRVYFQIGGYLKGGQNCKANGTKKECRIK